MPRSEGASPTTLRCTGASVIPPKPLVTDLATKREFKSAKLLIKHPAATKDTYVFDSIVELGAEFNQGRYIDAQLLAQDIDIRNGYMLCEIVFQFYSTLTEEHHLATRGPDPVTPVNIDMELAQRSPVLVQEATTIATLVLRAYGALKVSDPGELDLYDVNGNVILQTAAAGGVAHEVGSIRMSGNGSGVVDASLNVEKYESLFVTARVFPHLLVEILVQRWWPWRNGWCYSLRTLCKSRQASFEVI